jgi:hypothetical protein
MPEDDFDIYGEDDGFHVQAEEVCLPFLCHMTRSLSSFKSLGYDEAGNQDPADAAAHSPVIGEKRPREEDESEDAHEQSSGNGVKEESQEPQPVPTSMRSPNAAGNGSFPGNMGFPGAVAGQGQNTDALYIGDLQWVCVYCRLLSHVHIVLRQARCIISYSGQLMRTCVKSQQSWGLIWTTKTSPSPSIK